MHRTQSGGLHVLFCADERVGCTQSKIHQHVDTRGQSKGYCIWWPASGLEVINAGIIAAVPDFIIAALTFGETQPANLRPREVVLPQALRSPSAIVSKIAGIIRVVANAREGERNATLFWAACRMGELIATNAISVATASDLLVEAASRTGLSILEARRTVRSAFMRF
jgi:hypothetical protein